MSYEITFQPAVLEHAEGISGVICDAIQRINAQDYPAVEIDRLLQNFSTSKILELMEKRKTWVALSDGMVVGTGTL